MCKNNTQNRENWGITIDELAGRYELDNRLVYQRKIHDRSHDYL